MASIKLTAPIKAADKSKNETTIYIKAVEGVYTKEIDNTKEIREQDFRKKKMLYL